MQASVRVFRPKQSFLIICLMSILVGIGGKSWGQATLPVSASFSSVTTAGPGTMPTGFTNNGLGGYNGALKFDAVDEWLQLFFNAAPGTLTFDVGVNNSFPGSIPATATFTVQESANGTTWSNVSAYSGVAGGTKTITTLSATSRYIRWYYTTKPSGTNIALKNVNLAASASTTPTLSVSPALDFGNQCINTNSAEQNFTITGSNLTTANITVAALSGYAYSATTGGPYTSTLSLSQTGGSYSKVVYVQFTPTAVTSYNGTAAVGGGGAASVNETLNGAGINTTATATTGTASAITVSSATVAGSITTGCATVSQYGIEYSTTSGFTSGTGTKVPSTNVASGSYTSSLTGLANNTIYYYKAYADAVYGSQSNFTTAPGAPATTAATVVTANGFTANWTAPSGNGVITSYTLQYSTTSDFSSGNTTITGITATSRAITGLSPNTTYYYRVLAINSGGSSVYSTGTSVTTLASAPTVTTTAATAITTATATSGGNVTSTGGSILTQKGIVWSATAGVTLANASGSTTDIAQGTVAGSYTSAITGLSSNTIYYYNAYATNSVGTSYGTERNLTTVADAPVTTAATLITATGFTANWNAPSGNGTITSYTLQYSINSDFSAPVTTVAAITTTFRAITGLASGVTYYYRVLAINSGGSSVYSTGTSVTTLAAAPTVTTTTATAITYNSATSGGTVTVTNGAPVTDEGVVWGTSTGPTIALPTKTSDGTATPFTSAITGLTPATQYFYRAYATNSAGTSYGTERTFTTTAAPALTATPTTLSFANTTVLNASPSQSVALTGVRLVGFPGTITISAPSTDFQVSSDNITFGATATISYTSATLSSTPFYVRFTPQSVASLSGNVTVSGGDATTSVAVSGTGIACATPTTQATNVVFTNVAANSLTATWTPGNGSRSAVYINVDNNFTDPVNGTDVPAANPVYSGSGQQLVYVGTSNTVNVSGLSASTLYYVRVYTYNICSGTYTYQIVTATGNPNSISTSAGACTPLLAEDFDYGTSANSNLLTVAGGNWVYASGTTTSSFNYTPSRGLVYPGYASGGVGGSANIIGSNGMDIYRVIPSQTSITSGAVYMSFLMNFTSVTGGGDYFIPLRTTSSGQYYAKLFVRPKSGSTTTFELGLSKFAGSASNYTGTYTFGKTYLVVVKYQFNSGSTTNDAVSAWAFANGVPVSEAAATPLISNFNDNQADASSIYAVTMRQNSGTNGYVDGIRIAQSWADAVCAGPVDPIAYTWQPITGTQSFALPTNWSPVRSTIRNTDILNFTLGGNSTASNVTGQGLGKLNVANNTAVTFTSTGFAPIGLNDDGTTAADLIVAPGSTLTLGGSNPIQLNLIQTATAAIGGTLTFNGTTAQANRLTTETAGAITFASGSALNATKLLGSPFNNDSSYLATVPNGAIFQSGATYTSSDGANPFGLSSPSSAVVFNSGSNYIHANGASPSLAGRTYGNFEFNYPSGTNTISLGASTTPAVVQNNFTVTAGTFNINVQQPINVAGNLQFNGGTFNYSPSTASAITLNGTSAQTISGAGSVTLGATSTLSANNATSVTLARNLIIDGTLNLASGSFAVGANTLTLNGPAITGTPTNLATTSASSLSYGGTSTGIIIPSSVAQLNNLIVNNTSGISLGGSTTLAGVLTLTNGIVTTTSANTLTVANTSLAAIVGGSTTAFVSGPLGRTLPIATNSTATYNFPVGKAAVYLPFSLGAFTTTANSTITAEAFNVGSGGTAGTGLCAISNTEYWLASATTGYSTGSVSLTRQAALGNLNKIGRSATLTGAYNSLNGTVSGTSIINSDPTGSSLGYFAMGTFTEISGLTYTVNPASYCVGNTIATNSPALAVGTATSYSISPALPAGLSFSITTGAISGQPTVVSAATVYTIIATNATGCTTSAQVTITVNPTAVIANKTSTICSGSTFTVTPVNGAGGDVVPSGTTYSWTAPTVTGVTGTTAGTNQTSVSGTLTNTTTTVKTVVYNVTATSTGSCSSTFTVTVTLDAASVAGTISGAGTVCTGINSTTLTLNGYVGNIQWQSSTDNVTFNNIAGATSATYTATNLTATTYYRASVTSGSCTAVTSPVATIIVSPVSVAGTISGNGSVCSGTNSTTLTVSGYTGTIQWQSSTDNINFTNIGGATSATYTATNLTITTYYRVVVTSGSCSSATSASAAVTVNALPTASISGPAATLCPGSTSGVTITNTGNTSATITYTTQIGGGTIVPHQVTLAGNTGTTLSDVVNATTTYTLVSVTNGTCVNNAPNGQVVVSVYPPPAVPANIAGNNFVAVGATVQLSGTPASGVWSIDNTTFANFATGYNSTSNPVVISGKAVGTPTITYTVIDNNGCTNTASLVLTVYDATLARYRSKQDGKFSDASTWEVYTGSGNSWENATQPPSNSSNIEVRHNVRIQDGSYDGTSSATLTITNHTTGGNTVNGTLTVYPALHFQSQGNVNFNNNLVVLKSDVTGTAAIGVMGSAIANATNVQLENYTDARKVSGTTLSGQPRRAWRLITSPVTGQSIHESWQENQNLNVNPGTGFGTLITGEGLNTTDAGNRGFDFVGNGNHTSIRQYDSIANQWKILSTNANFGTRIPLESHQAYMLFVRGDRSVNSGAGTVANLRSTGTLKQGNQSLSVVPNRVVNGATVTSYTLVGNPYAAPINFVTILSHNTSIKNEFYLWNSHLANYGAYVLVQDAGNGNYQAIPQPLSNGTQPGTISGNTYQYIPSGTAFLVSPSGAASTTLTISEGDKSVGNAPPVNPFRVQPLHSKQLWVNLNLKDDDTSTTLADGFVAKFDKAYAGAEEENSSQKAWNFNENLNLVRNGKSYIAEARSDVQKIDTLFVQMWNLSKKGYQLQMRADNFASTTGTRAWLIDNYKETKDEISLKGNVLTFDFDVNNDTASSQSNRFMIVFKNNSSALPVTITKISAQPNNSGVNVNWTVTNETNIKGYTVEKSIDGSATFTAIGTQQLAKNNPQAALTSYQVYDAQPKIGDNLYRIRIEAKDGTTTYSEIVKVTIGANGSGILISLYPNPVREGKANLQLTNLKEGTYLVSVYTTSGQTLYQRKVTIAQAGITQSEPLLLGNNVPQGSYQIRVADSKGKVLYTDKLIVGR